ncbi:protein Iojap-related, mitochondrial isoform X2 [Quercus suber]|uniref:protein Iojap-related, mitochondrial isoform X2 n=1 Tax=Quercus suber TaxID=58331 RepID=UPI0032E005FB
MCTPIGPTTWSSPPVGPPGTSRTSLKPLSTRQAKQKQKGVDRKVLPSVEGQEEGKWIVIDSGKIIVHALDEKAREYYNLEGLWTTETSQKEPNLELEKAFVKIRPKNNSKKPVQKVA